MKKCFELALKGKGYVSPNPMVGCIVVINNKIIGQGYHKMYGDKHAEVNAIESVKDKSLLKQSTLYVNLEPCVHYGKTPPCSDLIIKHKIPKVVIGCLDTYSEVSGKGIEKMKDSNIEVIVGVLEKESKELNQRFFTFHEKKRPYIILKWAKSSDGFIAPKNQNKPFWITSNESKTLVHKWRSQEDAILVGRITAQKDNPSLTVRKITGNNPIRIVIDKKLELSNDSNIFNSKARTIVFNTKKSEIIGTNQFIKTNFNYLKENILKELHKQNIQSFIVEGGRITLQSFIDANTWDEARIFTTKKTIDGEVKAPTIQGKIVFKKEIGNDNLEIIHNR